MFLYLPLIENLHTPELGSYRSCGILALERSEKGLVYHTFVSDVSTDYDAVANLTRLCNEGQLFPLQLRDVIDNFL